VTDHAGITRRQLLGAGAGLTAAAVLGGRAARAAHLVERALTVSPRGSDLEAIEHVVVIMQENRSFDHYFGSYPAVRGFDDHPRGKPGVFAQPWPVGSSQQSTGKLLPYHLDSAVAFAQCAGNVDIPTHSWAPQHQSWAHGRMDAFVTTHSKPHQDGPEQGPLVMGYLNRSDLGFYYALADAFTICDGYFCSVIGPTMPNRLYSLSATIDPDGKAGGPVVETPGFDNSAQAVGSVRWETMFERLSDAKIDWKVYQPPGTSAGPSQDNNLALGFNALLYFEQYVSDPTSELYQRGFLPVWPDEFAADVAAGTLPAVSWMIPTVVESEHASAAPALGEQYVAQVLSTLVSNPDVWAKTVVFLVYDENGGFFDHVAPPTPPKGTPGEELTVRPLPKDAHGVTGPIGLGFRVPAMVISPFARGGYICSDTFDHTSLLRFLETRFGVKVPNLTAWRRKTVGDLTATLAIAGADRSVPELPAPPGAPESPQPALCPGSDNEASLLAPAPTLTVPKHQTMPRQERGRRKRRGG
jgi:phospholipase C